MNRKSIKGDKNSTNQSNSKTNLKNKDKMWLRIASKSTYMAYKKYPNATYYIWSLEISKSISKYFILTSLLRTVSPLYFKHSGNFINILQNINKKLQVIARLDIKSYR